MNLLEKITDYKSIIIFIVFILVIFYWTGAPEELDDPYIIYIQYDCRSVYRNPTDIPNEVIEQCKSILEEQNESKRSKYRT